MFNVIRAEHNMRLGLGPFQDVVNYADDTINKFGSNAAVGTSYETLWPEGGDKTFRTDAAAMTISSSASDTGDVLVQGVDGNWVAIEETVTLTGTTPVTLVNQYMVVHRMVMTTVANAGIVYVGTGTVTAGKPAVVECLVSIGENQSEVAFYAIPAGFKLAVSLIHVSVSSGKDVTAGLYVKPPGGVFNLKGKVLAPASHIHHVPMPTLLYDSKSIVQIKALVDTTTAQVAGGFDGYLLEDV